MAFNNRKFSMNRSSGVPRESTSTKITRRFSTNEMSNNGMSFASPCQSIPACFNVIVFFVLAPDGYQVYPEKQTHQTSILEITSSLAIINSYSKH